MSYQILYSPKAQTDVDEIWDGIYEISKSYDIADNYINDMRMEIRKKEQFPSNGNTPLL